MKSDKRMYHITDIKKFLKCERLYLLSKDIQEEFKPYLRSDENAIELLIEYFKIKDYFFGEKNDPCSRFIENINNYEWFVKARLSQNDLRINIPLMHKTSDGFDLFYLYYGTQIKELDTLTYGIAVGILESLNFSVNSINVVYLNEDYYRKEILDLNQLFILTDCYKDKKIIDLVNRNKTDYLAVMQLMDNATLKQAKKTKYCRLNGLCEHYSECFDKEENISDDSILTLVSSKYKNEMYNDGIRQLKDVDINRLEGNRVQYAQVMASKKGGRFVDKLALGKWLSQIEQRPISFIDFEWDRYLIPPYKAMKPLDVVCFEYALYYLDEKGHMEHRTFVGTGDCRKEFVEGLIMDLPKTGPILAYNAEGAECLRLKELGQIYPEYKVELDNMIGRFFDLAAPFLEGLIYDTRMAGNYTLKRLVDICSNYSYENLDICDGMVAVYNWRNMDKGTCDDSDKITNDLKQYCSLDAYGLFLVYKWLIELMIE